MVQRHFVNGLLGPSGLQLHRVDRRQGGNKGVQSIADLEQAIARYIHKHNGASGPFVWTKHADTIFAKLNRLPAPSE